MFCLFLAVFVVVGLVWGAIFPGTINEILMIVLILSGIGYVFLDLTDWSK